MNHTPGPWRTDCADHDAPYQNIVIEAGKHRRICKVWIDDTPVHDYNAEQQANARLIAAAPELLEALKAVMQGSVYKNIGGDVDWHEIAMPRRDALDKARAAIAKAEGKE